MPHRRNQAPTLATVAARAGVSRQTVSNALNNPALLRPETLEQVRSAIVQLGYSPNRAARNLRTRSTHLIGLRVAASATVTANGLMDRFLHSLVASSKQVGYHVLLFASPDDDLLGGYDELLRSAAVDAFVVTDTYLGNPQAEWLESKGVPFVAFGRPWAVPDATHPWVDVDGYAGVGLAVDHLVERGHRRIAWVGWRSDSFIGEDRRSGWVDRMHAHQLSTSRLSARGEDDIEFGARAARALFAAEQPTAFVCVSDTVALGVLNALSAAHRQAGDEVAVVGFDDSLAAQITHPGLTSVRPPLEQAAVEIVRMLGNRLSHQPVTERTCMLTPTLSIRATS